MSDDLKLTEEEITQMNNFVRGAKKKSSMKTSKTTAKDIHARMKLAATGTVKMKTLKWNEENIEKLQLEQRPLSNRRKLDDSRTFYKPFEGDDSYLKRLSEVNSTEATNELLQQVEKKVTSNLGESTDDCATSPSKLILK